LWEGVILKVRIPELIPVNCIHNRYPDQFLIPEGGIVMVDVDDVVIFSFVVIVLKIGIVGFHFTIRNEYILVIIKSLLE
jgi:hypothetical protein